MQKQKLCKMGIRYKSNLKLVFFYQTVVPIPNWLIRQIISNLRNESNNLSSPHRAKNASEILRVISTEHDTPKVTMYSKWVCLTEERRRLLKHVQEQQH